MKRSLLYLIDSLQTGGAEKSTIEIGKRLDGFEVTIALLFSANDDLVQECINVGIRVVKLNVSGRFWWRDGQGKLKNFLKENSFDLVHACLYKAEIITRLVLRSSTLPHIGSFVNDSYAQERYSNMKFRTRVKLNFYKMIDRYTAKWVPYFISITNTIAASNARHLRIPLDKITTIYRGRSLDDFNPVQPEYSFEESFRFLIVARLLKRKGHMEALRAAALLKKENRNFEILIAGDGADREVIKEELNHLSISDRVKLLGNVSNVPELLASSHAFIFPSHYEGQGGALVEAMLSAKPIIATQIPVFEEQVEDNQHAVLFELFSSSDLAQKMRWVMDHYEVAKKLGKNARTAAEERFDIVKIARQHNNFYKSILSDARQDQ